MSEVLIADFTLTTGADGSTTRFLYTSGRGWRTGTTDSPANTWIEPRVKSFGKVRRSLFVGAHVTGGVKPAGAVMYLNNGDGGLDPWRRYGVAGNPVVYWLGEEGAPFPEAWEPVQIMYMQSLERPTLDQVVIGMRDRGYLLDRSVITATFKGTGGIEGTGVASKKKQWVSGSPALFPPIVLDVVKQTYFVQEGSARTFESLIKLYEGGVEITRGANYTSEAEFLGTAPAPGTCRFWFTDTEVYVRLGTPPVFELRVSSVGDDGSGRGYWSFAALCRRAGLTDITADSGTSIGAVGARIVDDDATYLEVMDDSCVKYQQFYGFTRLDQFYTGMLLEPAPEESVYTFTFDNAGDFTTKVVAGMEAPAYLVTLSAGKTYPCTVASGASAEMKDFLSRDPYYVVFSGSNAAVKTANPGAVAIEWSTPNRDIQNEFQKTNFINRTLELFGGQRDFLGLSAKDFREALRIDLNDTVTVQIPRLDCDDGLAFRVIETETDWDVRAIAFGLWGGTPGDGGTIDGGDPGGTPVTDPLAIQTEDAIDILSEDGDVLLMESDSEFLTCENDAPLLTESNQPIYMEE